MESPHERLRKWTPHYVIESSADKADMISPETYPDAKAGFRLIAVRNLSRRILQKHCTVEGRTC